jgi:hypothetical protein
VGGEGLDFFVGPVALRLMRAVMTPPAVLIPREREATSRSGSCIFSEVSLQRMAAWTAAPPRTRYRCWYPETGMRGLRRGDGSFDTLVSGGETTESAEVGEI